MSERVSEHATRRASVKDDRRGSRRTSAATSTRSNKSSTSGKMGKDGPPTPESPQVRVTRKRAAETMEEDIHEAEVINVDQHMSPSHTRGSSGDSRDSTKSVCLCQPDPKIPRPRNAFILYRQHHQAAVAAQNPGLANPEISKIIGEQWRSQPASVKHEWKQLAEEEKLRHQRQYPEYRYRPRRSDRPGSLSGSENKDPHADKNRCQKCGGRSITTISPRTTSAPSSASLPTHLVPHQNGPPATPVSRYLPAMNGLNLNSHQARKLRGESVGLRINAAASRQYTPEETDTPMSPEAKRRRYNGHPPQYIAGRPPTGSGTPFYAPPPHSALHPMQPRREFLPPPADLFRASPTNSGPLMGPPPTPGRAPTLPMSPFASDSARHPGWERMSLTLPPLQNVSSPKIAETRLAPTAPVDESKLRERRSVEAMVMSMSHLGKLKILRKIAPPVGVDPTSQGPRSTIPKAPRGTIVAIESFNNAAVSELVDWLQSFLSNADAHDVKVWDGPRVPDWKDKASINDMLGVVREWHELSADVVAFIQSKGPADADKRGRGGEDENMGDTTPVGGKSSETQKPPVALLKSYTLQACDRYACAIPIQDAYSPADHWQWMATLWRGIPGADITVYVKEIDATPPPSDGAVERGGASAMRPHPEKSKAGTVDVVEEAGLKCLLVWKEKGKEIEASALRRLGFELGEWIRGFGTA